MIALKTQLMKRAAALCLAVGLAVPAAASSVQMTAEYFYTILNSATSAVNSVTASEDGTDVPTDQLWVTQAVLDEFGAKAVWIAQDGSLVYSEGFEELINEVVA